MARDERATGPTRYEIDALKRVTELDDITRQIDIEDVASLNRYQLDNNPEAVVQKPLSDEFTAKYKEETTDLITYNRKMYSKPLEEVIATDSLVTYIRTHGREPRFDTKDLAIALRTRRTVAALMLKEFGLIDPDSENHAPSKQLSGVQ